ncbi:MAG: CpsD/CapB family tyrosine-protein kinase [Acidobacteriaceae bacterium]|nr:CpsD/CapB family tyrosine-protein kinase [Acidobacteriaceae bacterium]
MSRVHEALRKAQQSPEPAKPDSRAKIASSVIESPLAVETPAPSPAAILEIEDIEDAIRNATELPYHPLSDALLVNPAKPREAPSEEFRTLRTRLNHLQSLQPLHTLVVTSASPAEGKSFTATNLAITQSQLADKRVLLADFDFRRPTVEKTFQIDSSPGISDYLLGKVRMGDIVRRIAGTNLYVMTAGEIVSNPLELLNLKECKLLLETAREHFDWVILDSPPLLFAADGNLLATMCDGTILVVRIGTTTFDSVTRALQSLCENNILGIVVNGARRGELYSKYNYYHNYYYAPGAESEEAGDLQAEAEQQELQADE